MRIILLVIVSDEVVEPVLTAVFCLHPPEQKRSKWVPLHKTIEQSLNLFWLPDELALDSWQNVFVTLNTFYRFFNGAARLIHTLAVRIFRGSISKNLSHWYSWFAFTPAVPVDCRRWRIAARYGVPL